MSVNHGLSLLSAGPHSGSNFLIVSSLQVDSRASSLHSSPHTISSSSSNSQSESSSTVSTPSPVTRVRSNCKRSGSGVGLGGGASRINQSHEEVSTQR